MSRARLPPMSLSSSSRESVVEVFPLRCTTCIHVMSRYVTICHDMSRYVTRWCDLLVPHAAGEGPGRPALAGGGAAELVVGAAAGQRRL